MTNKTLASIVIPNYNGKKYLEDCLGSLRAQNVTDREIILVDNGSTDGSAAYVHSRFPEVRVLELDRNCGFAAACNHGILNSSGLYVLIINNDTMTRPDCLERLIATATRSPHTGMVAPKILNFSRRDVIDSLGVALYPDGTSRGALRLRKDPGTLTDEREILCPSGCAALYRRAMLDQIGLFDEDFFAYCEDTDLGLRGRLAGWNAYCNPQAVVYHKYSGTTLPFSRLKAYLVERNRIWVALKNFPAPLLPLTLLFTLARYQAALAACLLPRSSIAITARSHNGERLFVTIARSWQNALAQSGRMVRKRRKIHGRKNLSLIGFLGYLIKYGLPLTGTM